MIGSALFLGIALTSAAIASPPPAPAPEKEDTHVVMETPLGEARSYWPRWRGPSGQGLAFGSGYPDTWSATENVLWKVEVPGRGNSSPIVWGDRLFLTTAREEGRKRSVLCFNLEDGKLLWETAAPETSPEKAHRKNGHASSTPSTDGKRVYAYLGNHGLVAVDFEGEIVWHKKLGSFEAYHGTASSPLLYRDRVIVVQDQQGPGGSFIAAFERNDTLDERIRVLRAEGLGVKAIATRLAEESGRPSRAIYARALSVTRGARLK